MKYELKVPNKVEAMQFNGKNLEDCKKLVRENNGIIEDLEQERHIGSKLRAVIRHNFVGGIESIEKQIRVEAGDYIVVGEENSIKVMSETKFVDLYKKIE